MARLRLRFRTTNSQRTVEAGGRVLTVNSTQLYVPVSLGPGAGKLERGVIDTGAYISVVPQSRWDVPGIRETVSWLDSAETATLTDVWSSIRGVGGTAAPARLGIILMTAIDESSNVRLTSSVIALMADDESLPESQRIRTLLIGLHFGLLDRRRLVIEPDSWDPKSAAAFLEDL